MTSQTDHEVYYAREHEVGDDSVGNKIGEDLSEEVHGSPVISGCRFVPGEYYFYFHENSS